MKKSKRKLIIWGYVIAAGWLLAVTHARGETVNYALQVKAQESPYQSPEDMISMVPILKHFPRSFIFGDGYSMKLSPEQLRIDHQSRQTRTHNVPRTCQIGLSYTAPAIGFFSSRIDLPILTSPTLALADWSRSSLSDYAIFMSRTPAGPPGIKIALSARF